MQVAYRCFRSPSKDQEIRKPEPKKSENELHWEELVKNMVRPLTLCDLDFTDLHSDDDKDDLMPRGLGGLSVPPPPPPIGIPPPMKPMPNIMESISNVRQMNGSKSILTAPPMMSAATAPPPAPTVLSIKKNKKTVRYFDIYCLSPLVMKLITHSLFIYDQVKLFWKEIREDLIPPSVGKTIWDEIPMATIDTQKLEHLFESRAKDTISKVLITI